MSLTIYPLAGALRTPNRTSWRWNPWTLNVLGVFHCFLGNQVTEFAPIIPATVGAGADPLTILEASNLDNVDR